MAILSLRISNHLGASYPAPYFYLFLIWLVAEKLQHKMQKPKFGLVCRRLLR